MSDYMCPNCVTPWKCNGPHIPEAVSDRPIHEVLAEISAKVPPEEWAKLDKTHYADPDTLATLAKLERENADLRADRDRAFKIGYEITDDCQTVEEMTSALVACIQRVRMNKDKELADLRAKLEEARKDAERYRWLRAHTGATRRFDRSQQFSFPRLEDEGVNLMHGSVAGHLDTAIDAAIAAGKGEK